MLITEYPSIYGAQKYLNEVIFFFLNDIAENFPFKSFSYFIYFVEICIIPMHFYSS